MQQQRERANKKKGREKKMQTKLLSLISFFWSDAYYKMKFICMPFLWYARVRVFLYFSITFGYNKSEMVQDNDAVHFNYKITKLHDAQTFKLGC